MVSGKYSALSAAIAREQHIANISANLANVTTTGYKKHGMSFESILQGEKQMLDAKGINYNRVAKNYVDFSQGALQQTNNPFNFAIVGDGFFKVRGLEEDLLTRNGNFIVDQKGTLVTDTGKPVLDTGNGEIIIPNAQAVQITVDARGRIFTVDAAGNSAEIAQLAVVDVEERGELIRREDTTFALPETAGEIPAERFSISQGSLEVSNVNMTEEMADMIKENRLYTTYHNVLKGYSTLGEKLEELGSIS